MDAKAMLESFLQTGKEYAAEGKNLAEQQLRIPAEGAQREAMLAGMGKGALAAGALALLLGTGAGRRLTGTALKVGSLAAIGGIAYKSFQAWQASNSSAASAVGTPVNELSSVPANQRSLALVKAMIAAAKADGHIDEAEKLQINQQIGRLQLDTSTLEFLRQEIDKPLNVAEIAVLADSQESAAEIYVASLMVINVDDIRERQYLDSLSEALNIPKALADRLEQQVAV